MSAGDPLYERACSELAALNARIIDVEVRRRVAEEIEARGLIPRPDESQPSGREVMLAGLAALEERVRGAAGTYVGAHKVMLEVWAEMGVEGASTYPILRRTRAQVEAAPNPERRSEAALGARAAAPWPVATLQERRAAQKRNRAEGISTSPVDRQAAGGDS